MTERDKVFNALGVVKALINYDELSIYQTTILDDALTTLNKAVLKLTYDNHRIEHDTTR